jgi:hypothetical protein
MIDLCSNLCLEDAVNPTYPETTVSNGNTANNMWFREGAPGYAGQCILDTLTYEQVIGVLERVPGAGKDLLKITNDPCLVELANKVGLIVPEQEQNQQVMDRLGNRNIPYYTIFRGNIDGSIL